MSSQDNVAQKPKPAEETAERNVLNVPNAIRHTLSFIITLGSLSLILYAIAGGYAALPGNPVVLYIIFFCVLTLLGYLEGLQVAILALEHTSYEAIKETYPRASTNLKLATAHHGLNVQRFLVGRQFFVVFVVFLIAQITTYADLPFKDDVPDWVYIAFISTGLPGALVVLSFGQLMPQLVAATHPVRVMNLPGSWTVIMITLVFESFGVTHFAWLLTMVVKKAGGCEAGGNDKNGADKALEVKTSNSGGKASVLVLPDLVVAPEEGLIHEGATKGLEPAGSRALDSRETASWLLRASRAREVEGLYSRGPNPPGQYPLPQDLCRELIEAGEPVPRYLLPPSHPLHIPPHVVAYDLQHRLEKGAFSAKAADFERLGDDSA